MDTQLNCDTKNQQKITVVVGDPRPGLWLYPL